MVQLLIYPSFKYFESQALGTWHRIYTRNMTFIVAPLMIVQAVLAVYFFIKFPGQFMTNVIYVILVAACWLVTLTTFIPLHNRIDKRPHDIGVCNKLTRLNWIRVFFWSLIFCLDLVLIF